MCRHRTLEQQFLEADPRIAPIPTGLSADLSAIDPSTIQAVVFDIYGTLVISGSGDISVDENLTEYPPALPELLHRRGLAVPPQELIRTWKQTIIRDHRRQQAHGKDYPEVDILEIWREVFRTLGQPVPDDLDLFAAEYESVINPVSPMPGLGRTLSFFKSRGIPMGIVSNAQSYTPAMLSAFLGKGLVEAGFHPDLLVFSYQHGYGKPSLHLYSILKHHLNTLEFPSHGLRTIGPENVLYVGNDMLKDCWAAAQLGFQTVLFAGDTRSLRLREQDPRCKDFTPRGRITALEQLTTLEI
ncbi:HAD family hydrolase [Spirochaeta lutea]|uniref:HAD family hydrolase n=1 Tax=Spirochaeta lutea TaxID=1480694 RepID=UPI00068E908F|nr:HAD family hydrolase [Spirochaeta lutea]